MNDYIKQLENVYDYYRKRSDEIFNEWLSATDLDISGHVLDQIWSKYRNFEGKCEGIFTSICIAKQHTNETTRT